jgi:hypothetical protein
MIECAKKQIKLGIFLNNDLNLSREEALNFQNVKRIAKT